MSDRAKALVEAFYKRPLGDYRRTVLEVRGTGGLDRKELAYIKRRVDPADVELIAHANRGNADRSFVAGLREQTCGRARHRSRKPGERRPVLRRRGLREQICGRARHRSRKRAGWTGLRCLGVVAGEVVPQGVEGCGRG